MDTSYKGLLELYEQSLFSRGGRELTDELGGKRLPKDRSLCLEALGHLIYGAQITRFSYMPQGTNPI